MAIDGLFKMELNVELDKTQHSNYSLFWSSGHFRIALNFDTM